MFRPKSKSVLDQFLKVEKISGMLEEIGRKSNRLLEIAGGNTFKWGWRPYGYRIRFFCSGSVESGNIEMCFMRSAGNDEAARVEAFG